MENQPDSLIDCYFRIRHNPFNGAKLMVGFYTGIGESQGNLMFAPLIIPICSVSSIASKLQKARFGSKKKSSVWTMLSDKSMIYDLQDRIDHLSSIWGLSIQHAINNSIIELNQNSMSIRVKSNPDYLANPDDAIKAAINLGKIASNHSPLEFYSFLGVRPI